MISSIAVYYIYIISKFIEVYEESRTSVKRSFLFAFKFKATELYSNSWIVNDYNGISHDNNPNFLIYPF